MKRHGSMNRRYRLVWSTVLDAWVVAAETARGACRGGASAAVGALLLAGALTPLQSQAGPQDGQVTSGSASISQAGATTTITQSSQNVSLTWKSFNTLPQEKVNFVQPSASAIAVNRILDTNGTQFLGQLNANGQVYLINPNGVLFGAGAQVNVGGLVASTLNLNDADLAASQRTFSGSGAGSVVNQGTINTPAGGYVALIGNTASNQGTINTPQGTAVLGAGNAVTLTFQDNQLLKVVVDQGVINSLADNGGLIRADGGAVFMSAGAKDSLLASVVNNTGVVQARTVENRDGTIVLLGGMAAGTTLVGGTLDASAPDGGNGGFIETSAAHVKVADSARITTLATNGQSGTWLIDPVDFTIAASGGDMTGAVLSTNLGSGNVTIQSTTGATGTAGNVNVNDTVSWSADNTLTLNAQNNININADITATGASGKVALEFGQSTGAGTGTSYNIGNGAKINLQAGNNFSTKQGSSGTVINYTVITGLGAAGSATGTDLQGMTLTGRYVLGTDIDASATSGWNSGAGFLPIGDNTTRFTGSFDGLGHTVSNLSINRGATGYNGLFGYAQGSTLRNVFLRDVSITGASSTASLVGYLAGGAVSNAGVTGGSVTGTSNVGGLVGTLGGGSIRNAHSELSGGVTGTSSSVGGLLGTASMSAVTIDDSRSTSNVSGAANQVGGLVGLGGLTTAAPLTINNSSAAGAVTATGASSSYIGGLVGYLGASSTNKIIGSSATGAVTATGTNSTSIGGLVGYMLNGNIDSSSATGAVNAGSNNASAYVGGLLGRAAGATSISNSYAQGDVTNSGTGSYVGGLVGAFDSTSTGGISASHANGKVTASGNSVGGLVGGFNNSSSTGGVSNSYATGNVATSGSSVGGLVGGFNGALSTGGISNSYATGNVTTSGSGQYIGGLVGYVLSPNVAISGSYATGAVSSSSNNSYLVIGGLVGNTPGLIDNSYAKGNVSSGATGSVIGGLAGNASNITNSYATGNVQGGRKVGGLVGYGKTIANSYATGSVTGVADTVGGLVGFVDLGTITNSYATGTVSGGSDASGVYTGITGISAVGGLVGWLSQTPLSNSYATGAVTGTGIGVGGLVGYGTVSATTISTSYATGLVTGSSNVGGLVGWLANGASTSSNNYWDITTTGQSSSAGGTGLTTAQLKQQTSYSGWDYTNIWVVYEGNTYALLRSFMKPLSVTANNTSKVYDATLYSGGNGLSYSISPDFSHLYGTSGYTGSSQGAKNVGSYTLTPNLYSDQQGYILTSVSGTLTITPASLTVTGVNASSKVYDATTTAILNGTATVTALGSDTVSVGGSASATFADADVGSNKPVTVTGYILAGADAGNYVIVQPSLSASITAVPPATPNPVSPPVRATLLPAADSSDASPTLTVRHSSSPEGAVAAAQRPCAEAGQSSANAPVAGTSPLLQVVDGGVCMTRGAIYATK